MELRPGLHRIQAPLGERFIALYLLEGPAGGLLVDTGTRESISETLLPYLASIGFGPERLRWVINTHCDWDHTSGNAAIRAAAPQAELLVHADDRAMTEDVELLIRGRYGEFSDADGFDDAPELTAFIRETAELVPVNRALVGGEEFDLGDRVVRLLHTPGHSPGHVAIWDPQNRALVIGDATLGVTVFTADGVPAFPPTYRDTDPYLATIEQFGALAPELLLTAHYPVYEGAGANEFLEQSAAYTRVLDSAIEGRLSGTGDALSTLELIHDIAAQVGDWPADAAEYLIFPLTGNLERLVRQGRVTVGDRDGLRTWSWAVTA